MESVIDDNREPGEEQQKPVWDGPLDSGSGVGERFANGPVVVPVDQDKPENNRNEPDPDKEFLKRIDASDLWTQVNRFTRNIEIEDDLAFYWPEKRKLTEEKVEELLLKRVLLLNAVSEDWSYRAIQRFASVMQATAGAEDIVVRITKSSQLKEDTGSDKLEFGFWMNKGKLPCPVIIVISGDRQDFIQKLLGIEKEATLRELLSELRKANLFIICEITDMGLWREIGKRSMKRRNEFIALWKIPCPALHVTGLLTVQAHLLLKELDQAGIMNRCEENILYEILTTTELSATPACVEMIATKVTERYSDIESKKAMLISILQGEDLAAKTAIFCGTYFSGLYFPDFFRLVMALLGEQTVPPQAQMTDEKQPGAKTSVTPQRWSDRWAANAGTFLKNCLLETKNENGNKKVCFVHPALAELISGYIEEDQYALFYSYWKQFEKTGLLTDTGLTETTEQLVIRFFSIAAGLDMATYNAVWLKNWVLETWLLYESNLLVIRTYGQFKSFLRRENKLALVIFGRIPLIISGLLRHRNEYFRNVIKDFFALLLSETRAKKVAVVMTAYLYTEFHATDLFSSEDLVGYFRRTLEEGKWDESFFAYDALIWTMGSLELREQSKSWLRNPAISDKSWTKQFAFLYQVDFILETIYRYYRRDKAEKEYELWIKRDTGAFGDEFTELVKDTVSEQSFESLTSLFNSDEGSRRFDFFLRLLDAAPSRKLLNARRGVESVSEASVIVIAEILETWFYIMTHKREEIVTPGGTTEEHWLEYAWLVRESCSKNYMRPLLRYWSEKGVLYSQEVELLRNPSPDRKKETAVYILELRKRKNSLKELSYLIQKANSNE